MRKDGLFPKTRRTWIDQRLDAGGAGRKEVNRHVMEVYEPCLRIWYLGSSFRVLGEAEEILNAFFADRLARDDFLEKWRGSGKPLRHWLVIAFGFFLRETLRHRKRDERMKALPEEVPHREDERAIDRIFAQVVVDRASDLARQRCEERGLRLHWCVFLRHRHQSRSYREIASEFETTPHRAAVMARTAERHFVNALRELVSRDGVLSEAMQDQLRCLLKASHA